MATKKQTRTTRTSKKTDGRSKQAKQAKEAQLKAKKQFWAIILFAVGIFIGAVTFIPGARVWLFIHNILLGLFGWGAYFIAPILIYIAVMATLDKPIGKIKHRVWQAFLIVALVCAAFQIFGNAYSSEVSFFTTIKDLYDTGVNLKGGGVISAIIGLPLVLLFDITGAKIVVCILIFAFVMLFSGSTLIGLYHTAAKPVKQIEQVYNQKQQARAEARFNIDIPLDNDIPIPKQPTKPNSTDVVWGEQNLLRAKEILLNGGKTELPAKNDDAFTFTPSEPIDQAEADKLFAVSKQEENSAVTNNKQLQIDDLIHKAVKAQQETAPVATTAATAPTAANQTISSTSAAPAAEPALAVSEKPSYVYPAIDLLNAPKTITQANMSAELKNNADRLVDTLKSFGVQTRIIDISRGPSVTRYELQPSAGVKISKITGLADDIALNLATAGVRIEAPIPNKAAVGIEVPNKVTNTVSIREIIDSKEFKNGKSHLTVALGRDIAGQIITTDLAKMPHVLIAGATGSGKSVCINSIIISLLYKSSPEEVKLLMVDPKVVELGVYNAIPHLLVPVVTDPRKAAGALSWAVNEMLKRYKIFAENSVRDLSGYNRLCETREDLQPLPQIVIIIDELADLMMAAPNEVEDYICRLAQMARAAGMHLVIATQRPSVDVITGVIKANIPSRIAFAVSSQVDSRTILDMGGAEKLLGRGDMLFNPVGSVKPLRVQGCFVTDEEIDRVTSFLKDSANTSAYDDSVIEEIEKQAVVTNQKSGSTKDDSNGNTDEMLMPAIECVVDAGMASTSLLQRRLKLGYARAARLIDEMESRGIVGPFEGSKPRQVLISHERLIEMKLNMQQQQEQNA